MIVGVAAWGADAAGRVEIQSVARLGPVMRVVFKVVGRCADDASYTACGRDVVPVHHFVSVPVHNGIVQFAMASADEPDMSWTATRCLAKRLTWAVDGNECSGRIRETPVGFFDAAINENPAFFGDVAQFCRRNAAQAIWWTDWADYGRRFRSCTPRPPPPPPRTDPLEIATATNCMGCHTVDGRDLIGPSFKRVADFYRDNPPAEGQLELKIKRGGAGVFGSVPMPANPQISDPDLAIVVPWILGLP